MADQNFRVKKGLEVGIGGNVISALSTGNLGIGTTNPTSKLHVIGDANIVGVLTATSFRGDGSQLTGITAAAAVSISTNTTNQSQFIPYVTTTGSTAGFGVTTGGLVFNPSTTRLGIGTTSPRANLDVTDSILVSTGVAQTAGFLIKSYTNNNGAISFEDVDNTNPRFSIDRDTSYLLRVNDSSFATRLILNSSGNLGIGTTNPTSRLHVIGDALITGISTIGTVRISSGIITATTGIVTYYGDGSNLTAGNATNAGYASTAGISTNATNVIGGIGSITRLQVTGISTFTNGPVFIGSGTSTGTSNQRLQVTGGAYVSGNLGIGTTSPRANLDVTDSILISTGVAQTAGFLIKSYTNSNGAISFEDVDNTNPRFSIDRDTSYLLRVNDSSFATRLILNSSGNLGIGTTNPTSRLHVIGDTNIVGVLTATSFRGDGSQLTGLQKTITSGTSLPTGGNDGDIYLQYTV